MRNDAPRPTLAMMAEQLRHLHRPGRPLVLPNVWDAATASLVAGAGFPAVATSSSAVAAARGYADDDTMPADEAFSAVASVARAARLPVTADVEAGYGLSPGELVDRLLTAGAVGCNLEDTDHHSSNDLVKMEDQARFIGDVKKAASARGVNLVVNARIDVFRFNGKHAEVLEEAVKRARAYAAAGADCLYPIRLADESLIAQFVSAVDRPVNILARRAPPISRLAELGVARVSFAGGLMAVSLAAVEEQVAVLAAEALEQRN